MKNQTPGEKIAGVPVIGSRMWESMTSEEIGFARDLARRIDRAIRNAVGNDRKLRKYELDFEESGIRWLVGERLHRSLRAAVKSGDTGSGGTRND